MRPSLQALNKTISLAQHQTGDLSLVRQAQLELVALHLLNIERQVNP